MLYVELYYASLVCHEFVSLYYRLVCFDIVEIVEIVLVNCVFY